MLYEAEERGDGNGLRHGNHIELFEDLFAVSFHCINGYVHNLGYLCRCFSLAGE